MIRSDISSCSLSSATPSISSSSNPSSPSVSVGTSAVSSAASSVLAATPVVSTPPGGLAFEAAPVKRSAVEASSSSSSSSRDVPFHHIEFNEALARQFLNNGRRDAALIEDMIRDKEFLERNVKSNAINLHIAKRMEESLNRANASGSKKTPYLIRNSSLGRQVYCPSPRANGEIRGIVEVYTITWLPATGLTVDPATGRYKANADDLVNRYICFDRVANEWFCPLDPSQDRSKDKKFEEYTVLRMKDTLTFPSLSALAAHRLETTDASLEMVVPVVAAPAPRPIAHTIKATTELARKFLQKDERSAELTEEMLRDTDFIQNYIGKEIIYSTVADRMEDLINQSGVVGKIPYVIRNASIGTHIYCTSTRENGEARGVVEIYAVSWMPLKKITVAGHIFKLNADDLQHRLVCFDRQANEWFLPQEPSYENPVKDYRTYRIESRTFPSASAAVAHRIGVPEEGVMETPPPAV